MPSVALPASSIGSRLQVRLSSLVGRPVFWLVFVAIVFGLPIVRTLSTPLPPPLPVLGTVSPFTLTGEDGNPFGSEQLSGRVWVANVIFTRCTGVCSSLAQRMSEIQHRSRGLGTAFHLVSFTADPTHDTPERLAAYAKAHKASPHMWTFVTGSPDELKRTVMGGLKLGIDDGGAPDDFMGLTHSEHFVLVDAKSRIRAFYDSQDPTMVDTILRDVGLVVNRGG